MPMFKAVFNNTFSKEKTMVVFDARKKFLERNTLTNKPMLEPCSTPNRTKKVSSSQKFSKEGRVQG